MATLSSKVTPSGVATAAQGTLADSAVQPNDSPTFAGLTTTADVSFGDNDKAIFGAGSDLQIYHDDAQSTNFLISQASANMSIGTSGIVNVGSSGSNVNVNGAVALVQGNDQVSLSGATVTTTTGTDGVVLDNNGSPKLATTATGIDVTGTVTADAATLSGRLTLPTATYHYSSDGYARLYYYEDGDTLFRTADDFQFRNLANTTIAQIQDTGAISTISTVTATSFIGDGSALTGAGPAVVGTLNGTGTIALQNSKGVSSVSDYGTGKYGFNFSSNFPTVTYYASGTTSYQTSAYWEYIAGSYTGGVQSATRTTSQCRVGSYSSSYVDTPSVGLMASE